MAQITTLTAETFSQHTTEEIVAFIAKQARTLQVNVSNADGDLASLAIISQNAAYLCGYVIELDRIVNKNDSSDSAVVA